MTSQENLEEFGTKLKIKRLQLNLTQFEVSEYTGINRATLSQIENGKNFSVKYLFILLKKYELLDELFELVSIPEFSPIEMWKMKNKQRKRASGKRNKTL